MLVQRVVIEIENDLRGCLVVPLQNGTNIPSIAARTWLI
jgi:hypothetical protein